MLSALTIFVDNFEGLSAFAAGVERLHQFRKVLEEPAPPSSDGSEIASVQAPEIALQGVTLKTPGQGRVLVSDVSVESKEFESTYFAKCIGGLIKTWRVPKHRVAGDPVIFPFKF